MKEITRKFVNAAEASAILGLDRTTVQKACKKGKIAEAEFFENQWRIPVSCLKKYWPTYWARRP